MMSVLGPRSPQLKYFHRRDAHVFRETADGHDVLSSSIRKDTDESTWFDWRQHRRRNRSHRPGRRQRRSPREEIRKGHGRFIGRFNEETFIVAQAPPVPAPLVHNNAFPDASINPVTDPLHTFHLGLWFNSSKDAKNAGCPADTTPSTGSTMPGSRF